MLFYAVANGRNIGLFTTWNECNNSVKGYKNAVYKKFDTKEEADNFILAYNNNNMQTPLVSSQTVDFKPDYYVYTDGACSNNGKDNASAGIGIFFGIDDIRNVAKKIIGTQTNNRAELTAIIETYYIIEKDIVNEKKIAIVSDSEYAIKCVSAYGEKCAKNSWKADIPNKELVKTAYEMYKDKLNIQFIHVKAHTKNTDIHSVGNDNADKLATMAIVRIPNTKY
jgi:ribonuclease HI